MTSENNLVQRRAKRTDALPNTEGKQIPYGMATSSAYFRPIKLQITLRVDADVIAWFRENHPRYQTLMNAVLRKEMTQALAEEQRERLERSENDAI